MIRFIELLLAADLTYGLIVGLCKPLPTGDFWKDTLLIVVMVLPLAFIPVIHKLVFKEWIALDEFFDFPMLCIIGVNWGLCGLVATWI